MLRSRAHGGTPEAGKVRRDRIVLKAADGESEVAIGGRPGTGATAPENEGGVSWR
jgi:hypothetical protein